MDGKTSLLGELAHELRDALSPIRPALDLMRLKAFEPQLSQTLTQRIQRAVENSLARLDGFVIAEQYRDGGIALNTAAMPLTRLLQQLGQDLPQDLRERCDFELPDGSARVVVDAARALQALTSMLENAARAAAREGRLRIRARADATRGQVHVSFTPAREGEDSLPGFTSYRAHGSSQTALRTAREILRLHGGDLVLLPSPGSCELVADFATASGPPAPAVEDAPNPEVAAQGASRRASVQRVLIVDDSPEVRQAYLEALSALGYSVGEAHDAQSALAAAAQQLPDVALLDIHLPGMNGYQLARRLKGLPQSGALRLVMLSGMTLDEVTRRESQAAGFDACFDKASGPRALQALLNELP